MMLRKIPLGPFIEILQSLYEEGADFIDLSGESNDVGENLKDSIKITVKPEYLSEDDSEMDLEIDFPEDTSEGLSEDDINELI